jgi:hypothetical protein
MSQALGRCEIVDRNQLKATVSRQQNSRYGTADTTEPVNRYLCRHFFASPSAVRRTNNVLLSY